MDTPTTTWHQLSVAVLYTINNFMNNTVNDPAPPQLVKVLTEVLWQSCCGSAQFPYRWLFFPLCFQPYHTAAEEIRHLWLTHSHVNLWFKYRAETSESWGDTGFEQRTCPANGTVLRGFHSSNTCQVCHGAWGYEWQHLKFVCIIHLRYTSHNCSTKLQQSLVWKSEWKVGKYRFGFVAFLRATGHLGKQMVFIWCFGKPLSAHV